MKDDTLPATNGDRHEASGSERATTGIDRRGYLKLAGGTAASLATLAGANTAGAASYETITVPADERYLRRLNSGESFENVLVDITAPGAVFKIVADGTGWTIRNVGIKGRSDTTIHDEVFNLAVAEGGTGRFENIYLGDGAVAGDYAPIFVPLNHAGTMEVRGLHVRHWPNNGFYASAPGIESRDGQQGAVQVEDSYARNNNIDGFRLGTDGSYLRNSVVHVDGDVPDVFGGKENARGVWIREGGRVTIEDCDILLDHPDAGYCIRQDDGKNGDDGVARIVDSQIRAGEGARRRYRGNVATSNVGNDPDVSPPESVPMSAEEAASGGESPDPEPDGPGLFTISNRAYDTPAAYEFTVSGALEATDSVNLVGSDEISGTSARGRVNAGSDTYRVAGAITDIRVDGPVDLSMDGEAVTVETPNRLAISDEGVGDPSEYQFTVSGDLAPTDSVNLADSDEISGSSAQGQVNGGTDAYRFGGGIERFVHDGPLTVALNNRETDPASLLPHELRIEDEGVGDPSEYRFTVSGDLAPTDSVNPNDEISGSSARGQVNGGGDAYYFSGDVTAFAVENSEATTVYIDGERIDPDQLGLSRSITISDEGVGDPSEYRFTVSGGLGATDSVNLADNDEISGSSAQGQVNGGSDSYRFDGEITAFAVENPEATTVSVDGERVDPGQLGLPHAITVSNRPYDTPATYRFEVSGDLGATASVNLADSDEIDGSSARGQVNGGSDTYRYSGNITAFENDGPVDVSVDGRVVQSSSG